MQGFLSSGMLGFHCTKNRKGEYLFKQNPVEYEVKLDLGVKY